MAISNSLNAYAAASYNDFAFNFQTSTGDKIALSLYDNKEMSYKSGSGETSLSLSHSYGYRFELDSSNGLSFNDMSEISDAMKKLEPQIDEFLQKIKQNEPFSDSAINNIANSMLKSISKNSGGLAGLLSRGSDLINSIFGGLPATSTDKPGVAGAVNASTPGTSTTPSDEQKAQLNALTASRQNALSQSILELFDSMLQKNQDLNQQTNSQMLERSNQLFKSMINQFNNSSYYA